MTTKWTATRRARQALLIRDWMPWRKSTGPTTIEGKAKSSRNAYKGGAAGRAMREAQRRQMILEALAEYDRIYGDD